MYTQAAESALRGSPIHRPMLGQVVPQPETFMSVQEWLLQARLHKYTDKLDGYSFAEVGFFKSDFLDFYVHDSLPKRVRLCLLELLERM